MRIVQSPPDPKIDLQGDQLIGDDTVAGAAIFLNKPYTYAICIFGADAADFSFQSRRAEEFVLPLQCQIIERGACLALNRFAMLFKSIQDLSLVKINSILGSAIKGHSSLMDVNAARADIEYGGRAVRHEKQGRTGLCECSDPVKTFLLEKYVSHCQCLVHDQNVRPNAGGHAEGEPHLHAAGIDSQRGVDVFADFSKGFDLRHQCTLFVDRQPHQLS